MPPHGLCCAPLDVSAPPAMNNPFLLRGFLSVDYCSGLAGLCGISDCFLFVNFLSCILFFIVKSFI